MKAIVLISALASLAAGALPFSNTTPHTHTCSIERAVCRVTNGTIVGTITLNDQGPGLPVSLTGQVSGLSDGKHGFHVHQYGDLSDGCRSAGGHFNPFNNEHGAPSDANRHVGDLGNIDAMNGVAQVNIIDNQLRLCGPLSIMGRAIVVHQMEDDLGRGGNEESKRTGNAGARVGCCVIGVAP